MQLSNSALFQVLLSSRDIVTLGKVLEDLLPGPTTWENPCLGVRKAPFDIRNIAVVGALGTEMVRVLKIQRLVGSAYLSGVRNKMP